jgi:Tol biopolymer transport system component
MSELKEVFEMVSQNVEPDADAWRQQDQRHRRSTRNRKIGAFAVVAALMVAAVVAAVTLPREDRTSDVGINPPSPLRPGVYVVDLSTGEATLVPDLGPGVGELAVSPDGTMVTYSAPGAQGVGVVHVADLAGSDVRVLERTGAPGGAVAPSWSPDGSTIVYQAQGGGEIIGNLFLVDVVTGETTQITDLDQVASHLWFMGPRYTPDGDTILFTMPGGAGMPTDSWNLWSVPVTGGDPTLIRRNAGIASVSPDGREIAYVGIRHDAASDGPRFGDVFLASVDGSDARRLADGQFVWPRWSPDGSKIAYSDERFYSDETGGATYVSDVLTRETSTVFGNAAYPEWVDDETLILAPSA